MQVGQTEALGRRISFVAAGSGDREVLFIHGFGADRSTWTFTLRTIANGARVVAVDLPGHGRSSTDVGSGEIPFLADVILAFMDAAGLAGPHIVGHSLGGAIALDLATREPVRVSGLSLIAPAGVTYGINRDIIE